MTKTYEQKLAERKAKAVARKATAEWYKLGNVGIDRILKSMDYRQSNYLSMYQYENTYWMGMEKFKVVIDTFDLIHHHNGKLNVTVTKIEK